MGFYSGLDSVTSKQCIKLMQELAREGPCTIIINIHQPSAILFDMIDHLYVIVGGRCVYTGSTKAIVPFLAKHGLHCPTYYNPADFRTFFYFHFSLYIIIILF